MNDVTIFWWLFDCFDALCFGGGSQTATDQMILTD